MSDTRSSLSAAFAEDHRRLTREFAALREAVEANDPVQAAALAEVIDRDAGPHIEFEETMYYPVLRRLLGEQPLRGFYEEHEEALAAIATLLERDASRPFKAEEQRRLLGQIDAMVAHALSCGTLVSQLGVLDEEQQAAMLKALQRLRRQGRRWTSLHELKER